MVKKPAIQLGPVAVTQGDTTPSRIALLLWGPASAGKTTFAATAPGDKLWVSFGDNEHVPVIRRKDVRIADMSGLDYDELFKHAQSDNPFGLDKILADNQDIGTVVVDSATAIVFKALQKVVLSDRIGAGKGFTPSMEAPGISAYGARNSVVLQVLTGMLRVTTKHNVHCIITAHEDDPTTKKEGQQEVIDYIAVQLGGKLVNNMSWRFSEIWHLRQAESGQRDRVLTIRAYGLRRPMKTRMFSAKSPAQFALKYDADLPDGKQHTIASWHDQWLNGGREPIPTPK